LYVKIDILHQLFGENINAIKEKNKVLNTNKKVGLKVNTDKKYYIYNVPLQNAGQNHAIKTANKS
jgi:hypothetical protein